MLPVLDGLSARNWGRDSDVITQEIFIISMAIIAAADAKNLSTTVQFDTTVTINAITVTGSVMTNNDATGLTYYNVWSETTTDAKLKEQMDTVVKYCQKYS